MRIVVLTQYFPPDLPGGIPNDIATELSARGHDVKVLTTFPHYTTGKIAEGYKQRIHFVEHFGRIPVRRVPIFPSHSGNPVGRVANYLSFAWSARLARKFVEDADVIYVHGTPALPAAPARVWSSSLGIPFVYHVQDIWPESVSQSGFLPKPLASVAELLINHWLVKVYASAAAVIAIAPTAQEVLIERGVPRERCHLVFNWSGLENVSDARKQVEGPGLTLVYAGNLGKLQDLETVIRAAHKLRDLDRFRLLIAGSGAHEEHLRTLVTELNANDSVRFLGRLDQDQAAALYAEADFQVVPLKNLDIFAGTIPSKFQAGLAHHLPLITTVKGDVTRLVDEYSLGFSALPEDVDSLASAFRRAYNTSMEDRRQLSQRAGAFYESHMSKSRAMDKIEIILQRAARSEIAGR